MKHEIIAHRTSSSHEKMEKIIFARYKVHDIKISLNESVLECHRM